MKLKPLKDRIVIKPKEAGEKTEGGIFIPESAKEKTQEGEVVAVWSEKDSPVKVGDLVVFESFSGTEITINEEKHTIMNIKDV